MSERASTTLAWIVLVFGAFALACSAGCGPYGSAYLACLQGKGIQAATSLPGQVVQIMDSSDPKDATVNALLGLAGRAGGDAVDCAVQTWLVTHPVPRAASPSPHLLMKRAAAEEYLVRKK